MRFFTAHITNHRFSLSGFFLFRGGFRRGSVTLGAGLLVSLTASKTREEGTNGISYVSGTSEVTVPVGWLGWFSEDPTIWSTCLLHKVPPRSTLYDRGPVCEWIRPFAHFSELARESRVLTASPDENSRTTLPQCLALVTYCLFITVVVKSDFMMSSLVRMFQPYMRMDVDSFVVPCGVIRYLHRNELSFLLIHAESPDSDLMGFLNDWTNLST